MAITDDFSVGSPSNGTDIASYNSGKWAYVNGSVNAFQIQTNAIAMGNHASAVDSSARRTDGTFPADQFAQVKHSVAMAGGNYFGVSVRNSATEADCYMWTVGNGGNYLAVLSNGSWSQLGSDGSRVSTLNDVYKLTITGSALKCEVDSGGGFTTTGTPTSGGDITDATFAAGAPGLAGYNNQNTPSTGRMDDFACSDLEAGLPSEAFFENRHGIAWGMKAQTAAGMGGVIIE